MKKKISVSNKILGLQRMKDLGFNVPEFDFIPDYTEIGLKDKDININYPPEFLQKKIIEILKKFCLKTGISVRSASFDEDNSNQSSAGRYLSFNGLTSIEEIVKAVLTVWAHHRQNSKNVKCPIIIQSTHPSFYSGVAFKDGKTTIIESYYGACSNIVDGSIKPYITMFKNNKRTDNYFPNSNYCYLFKVHADIFKDKNLICGEIIKPKSKYFTLNNQVYNFINNKTVYIYGNRPEAPTKYYDKKIIPQLMNIISKLDNTAGVDIEWGSDINGNVYVYQFRKLTRNIKNLDFSPVVQKHQNNSNILYGTPVSSGIAEGPISYDTSKLGKGSILFLEFDNVENINCLKNVKGVISMNGGILSHLSIICREMEIPCIVGIDTHIQPNQKVKINGNTGEIVII